MTCKERVLQFVDDFSHEELTKKYLYDRTWVSGSSTAVHPVTVWRRNIVIQWNSDKNIFNKFIERTVEKNKDIFRSGAFWKSDGSCPSTITFFFTEEFQKHIETEN